MTEDKTVSMGFEMDYCTHRSLLFRYLTSSSYIVVKISTKLETGNYEVSDG